MPRLLRGASADAGPLSARHRLEARLGRVDRPGEGGAALLPWEDTEGEPANASATRPERAHGRDGPGDGGGTRVRWRTRIRVVVLAVVPVVLFFIWCAWQAFSGQATVVPLEGSATGQTAAEDRPRPAAASQSAGSSTDGRTVVVHVAGAVRNPGIVSVREGSRVFEAIDAAGGAAQTADLNQLNLAGVVHDGEKLHVPQQGEVAAGAGSGGGGESAGPGGSSGGKVNINQASAEELGTLPRVGPVLAKRIVAWRTEHGPFKAVEELDAVDGVGPKLLEALLPLVTV